MKKVSLLLCLALILILSSCDSNPVAPEARGLTQLEKQLVEADNKFGLKLFKEIVAHEDAESNVFVSPLSVSMALGMTLNGAEGETRDAMTATLEFAGMHRDDINPSYRSLIDLLTSLDRKVIFEIANSIWYKQGYIFKEEFLNINRTYFDAVVRELDFGDPQAAAVINGWVKDKTHGKIEEIVEQIEPHIVMFLINAIYFKGTWTYEFDRDLTVDDQFTLPNGGTMPVKMMHLNGELPYFAGEQFQAVDLPYGDGSFSMTILLPASGTSVDALLADLTAENWQNWTMDFKKVNVDLALPRFKVEYEIELKDVLSALGMAVAFDPNQANFRGMADGPNNLFIDKVKHKTFVEVDEKGTEAAAVTSVEIGETSVGPGNVVFRVDRPFLFAIREHHSGVLLFFGKITEPQQD